MPAGSISPFWEPLTQTSTPHSSMRKSMLASALTESTNSSAGCLRLSIAWRTAATSLVTPVAVSFWHTNTALIRCCRSDSSEAR